jgi:uncharacterized membrane protein YbaN (DUF454 family)
MLKRKKRNPLITTIQQAKRLIKIVIGFTVVLFGIIGLFVPVLQGVVTIVLGLAILGTEFVWARRLIKRFEKEAVNMKNTIFNTNKSK